MRSVDGFFYLSLPRVLFLMRSSTSLLVAAARCIYIEASMLTIPRRSGERFTSVNRVLRCAVRNLGGSWVRLRLGMVHGTEEDFAASVRFEICAFEKTISRLYSGLSVSGRTVLDHVLSDAREVVGGDEKYLMRFVGAKMRTEPFGQVQRQITNLKTEAAVARSA